MRDGFTQQRLHVFDQRMHAGPDLEHFLQHLAGKRVALLTPVVLRGFGLALAFIGFQRFVKQIAAVKRMFAQHALAPGIDGVNGCIVHALRGHIQTPGGSVALIARRIGVAQITQKLVMRLWLGFTAKALHGFDQPGADAVRQLARGGAGEGHHQNIGRHQRLDEAVPGTMAQHQAQIQRGNRPGLARACAGLDQARAPQGEMQWLQRLAAFCFSGRAHACSPWNATSGTLSVVTCASSQSCSGPYTCLASASKRKSPVNASQSG